MKRSRNPYVRLLERVIEWPSPWGVLAAMTLGLAPCVAFPFAYNLLVGWAH